ncbi:unnamed protein product [Parnassius mnemosyne]|uniref:Regulatory protein zeste n=1 Tax=Parnassius mnemosyne TaxID=213953 RepID=A0AAV1K873_9NEOP
MNVSKRTAMTNEEVFILLDLVEANPIITSKSITASTNKLKEEAWTNLTKSFNASISSTPRSTDQLRFKWDNLKKMARKRSPDFMLSNLKLAGDKKKLSTQDDILNRVTSILVTTCDGFTAQFGGDSEQHDPLRGNLEQSFVSSTPTSEQQLDINEDHTFSFPVIENDVEAESSERRTCDEDQSAKTFVTQNSRAVAQVPRQQPLLLNTSTFDDGTVRIRHKKKLLEEDIIARTARNNAIAEYYIAKRKKLEQEIDSAHSMEQANLLIENQRLKSELDKLKSRLGS